MHRGVPPCWPCCVVLWAPSLLRHLRVPGSRLAPVPEPVLGSDTLPEESLCLSLPVCRRDGHRTLLLAIWPSRSYGILNLNPTPANATPLPAQVLKLGRRRKCLLLFAAAAWILLLLSWQKQPGAGSAASCLLCDRSPLSSQQSPPASGTLFSPSMGTAALIPSLFGCVLP